MYYNQIDQITARGYHVNKNDLDESIEVLVYPSEELYKALHLKRGNADDDAKVEKEIANIISVVNKKLLPYQRITKMTFLKEPLEMTTTKKVKRHK